jgi:hypothetical protein
MPPPMTSVDFGEEVFNDQDLVADLGAAEDGDEGTPGLRQRPAQVADLPLHQKPGHRRRQQAGHAFGGGMGAVRGAESIVHVEIGEGG